MKYQNDAYSKGKSSFIQVDPVSGQQVTFQASRRKFQTSGVGGSAVNAVVRLTTPVTLKSACDPCQLGTAESTFEIRFNVVDDATVTFETMRAEALRLLDMASNMYLLDGVVPGPNANLDSE